MLTTLPETFPEALRLLRKRSRLTQDEMGRAVGYSREQIARLENGSRLPDLAVLAALFVPALFQRQETALVEQFLALAGRTRSDQQVTITRTRETRVQLTSETIVAPAAPLHRPPAPLLPLIGRAGDVADLLALLQSARLLTIVGAPGIGKSRLALEVANQAMPCFADGVAFVPLADVAAAGDVPVAVLRALGLMPSAGQPVDQAIEAYLAPRRLLLVVDNCEHVLESTPLFADWLSRSPHLKLLCTSRVPLDLYGEQEWPLGPLPAPNLAQPPDAAIWGKTPAMQLLLARVRAADPAFALADDNLLPLATLCVALDGLPLALELAAVRLRELPPQVVAQQLLALRGHGQLSSTWLQQTRRNVAERHRTLHAAIEWSVQMLPDAQQDAFLRLGVFVGGCTAEAAQAVAEADAGLLAALARANLVAFDGQRVTLLETLRAYALERLAGGGQVDECQQRHALHYHAFAGQVFAGLLGDDQAVWMQAALADHNNCLAALRWALGRQQGEIAIALAGHLWWFWYRRGLFDLGQELLQAALQFSTPDPSARARALNGLASFHLAHDDYAASLACHEEGLALRRQLGDALGVATALHNMGLTAYMMGDYGQAIDWLLTSIDADPAADPAQAWANIGVVALDMQDCAQARRWLERAHREVMQGPAGWMQAFVLHNLADVLYDQDDLAGAKQMALASLQLFSTLGDSHYLPDPQLLLARIAIEEGDYAAAEALAALALAHYEGRADAVVTASAWLVQAELAWRTGRPGEAATRLQRAQSLRATVKRPMSPRERARYDALRRVLPASSSAVDPA
ncbi:MAG TPA: tetratricopeptide repeat protein [Anaerolineae bacterium]|nr:tetratricopeptide repeat protein [Anaerolineae bacterium]